ncbi:hypothetical protein DM02DRAFT_706875 [Periconia macrospinosa]|uniref:Uncharacterized protein n=1 Tax=Periconia macrospinosa TaxID=97972 RepID=A0A2V1DSF1_9PLEO|nr:hypothetical protein DM02DRAFT_706875 [Periconia macrospinosa]
MALFQRRSAPVPGLSPTLVVAISTGFGVVLLSLIITLVCLLIRSIRKHKRLLADLEHRGVILAQQSASSSSAKNLTLTKPRAVLKKHRILPFNLKTGWGALPSVETVHDVGRTSATTMTTPEEPTTAPKVLAYYVPPKPAGFVERPKRLSWPFSARRPSGRAMRMRKIRAPPLSTVIESPKPSPLVPVLSAPDENGAVTEPRQSHMRSTSDQSLLQRHPVFRGEGGSSLLRDDALRTGTQEPLRRSMTARPVSKPEVVTRANRSNSIADIPVSDKGVLGQQQGQQQQRPPLHARSASLCSQASGNAPEGGLPPLPLQIALVKGTDVRRRSLLSRSPSRMSSSSFESADTTILTQSSPLTRGSAHGGGVRKVTKRDPRSSSVGVVTPRAVRNNTVVVHRKNHALQNSVKGSITRFSSATMSSSSTQQDRQLEFRHSLCSTSPSSQTLERASSLMSRSIRTPKRRSVTSVTPYGSPEDKRKRSSVLQGVSGNHGIPARQLSQASTQASSTRSSNGNPFQWDSAPMSSAGKPSNLKGSPLARKGHRRQNCVRLVIEPTVFGGRSRSASPAFMKDTIHEESPPSTANGKTEGKTDVGLGFTNRRSLPQPPSSATFAPDVKIATTTTSLRASLTPSSPTLSVVNYDHGPVGSPVRSYKPRTSSTSSFGLSHNHNNNRRSTGPKFYIPTFPNPYERDAEVPDFANAPPTFALSRCSPPLNGGEDGDVDTVAGASSPFEMLLDLEASSPSQGRVVEDEYDPEHPQLVFHHTQQQNSSSPKPTTTTRNFSSPFSTILEETPPMQRSSPPTLPSMTMTTRCSEEKGEEESRVVVVQDSPPCSPKTMPASMFEQHQQHEKQTRCSAFDLPIHQTAILEESDVIDPALLLNNEAFHSLPPPPHFEHKESNNSRSSSTTLTSTTTTPLPPFSFPATTSTTTHADNTTTSTTTSIPSTFASAKALMQPLLDAAFPSSPPPSPRPKHASLPASPSPSTRSSFTSPPPPALDFTTIPSLAPNSLNGPRGLPARPLRSSILELRRMNSDAERGDAQRGVRRYRRLGREDSIGLPGEESFMDGLFDEESEVWGGGGDGKGEEEDEDEGELTWSEERERRLVGDLLSEDWENAVEVLPLPSSSSPSSPSSSSEEEKESKKEKKSLLSKTSGGGGTTTITAQENSTQNTTTTTSSSSSSSQQQLLLLQQPTSSPPPPPPPDHHRSSSIWEDGEKFWASTPPHYHQQQPQHHHHTTTTTTTTTIPNSPSLPPPPPPPPTFQNPPTPNPQPKPRYRPRPRPHLITKKAAAAAAAAAVKKRSSTIPPPTPMSNVVKIQVFPPLEEGGRRRRGTTRAEEEGGEEEGEGEEEGGTPGKMSLYDAEGFLRG